MSRFCTQCDSPSSSMSCVICNTDTFPLCSVCHEDGATIDGTDMCRDCDIETSINRMKCSECGMVQWADWVKAMNPGRHHAEGCSKEPVVSNGPYR